MSQLQTIIMVLDFCAIAVFAATGALAAARRNQDIIAFCFFGTVTGVGGGTVRDLLIGAPVFWIAKPSYMAIAVATSCVLWLIARPGWRLTALLWLDAVGMAAYAVVGSAKALDLGVSPLPAIIMGAITASVGGIIRDVLAGEPSILLRREIYITAALVASTVYVGLRWLGMPYMVAGPIAFAAGFGLRACALRFGWSLPPPPFGPKD
jgi:uncharacterized membrane protein YeiH